MEGTGGRREEGWEGKPGLDDLARHQQVGKEALS